MVKKTGRFSAVIWDFGGVFTTSPFEAFSRYERDRKLPQDFIRTVNATNPHENAWALFERAEISSAQFDQLFATESERLGHRVQGRDVLRSCRATLDQRCSRRCVFARLPV